VVVHVRSLRFYRQLLRGSIGLCESYMDELWECDDLVGLTRLAALNVGALDALRRRLAPVLIPVQRWRAGWRATLPGARGGGSPPTTTSATSCSRCSSTAR